MHDILGVTRSAVDTYSMIEDGDVIAVGCSGGKDSTLLLAVMNKLSQFYPKKFRVMGITVDMGAGADYSPLSRFCEENEIEYHIVQTNISRVVFDVRKESNPCSLCAKMRRGALNNSLDRFGVKKVALAHHRDDVAQTLLMNIFHEGRIGCFQPVTYLSRKDVIVIRPFVFLPEKEIVAAVSELGLPIVKNPCRADGNTEREAMKNLLKELEITYPGVTKRVFGAVKRSRLDGWNISGEYDDE